MVKLTWRKIALATVITVSLIHLLPLLGQLSDIFIENQITGQSYNLTKAQSTIELVKWVIVPHIVPAENNGSIEVNHKFNFEKWKLSVTVYVNKSIYEGAKNGVKVLVAGSNESNLDVQNITKEGLAKEYLAYINDPYQEEFYDSLISQFRDIKEKHKLTDDEYLELITAFVQSIPYDYEKAKTTLGESHRFPIETFVDKKGVCGDKSLLLAGLLSRENYDVALLLFLEEKHMAVGIRTSSFDYKGTGYAFIETTEYNFVGIVPDEYAEGIKLRSTPIVIKVGNGTKSYNSIDQTMKIWKVLKTLEDKINDPKMEDIDEYNFYYDSYNYILEHRYDRKGVYEWIMSEPKLLALTLDCPFLRLVLSHI